MRILFVSAVLPYPLYSGGQIRIYNLLKKASLHHDITLCAFTRDSAEDRYKNELKFCKKVHTVLRGSAWQWSYVMRSVLGRYPFVFSTYNLHSMQVLIEKELSRTSYDLIHIEPGYVFPSLPKTNVPIVVGEHNIEHEVYEGYIRRFSIIPLRPLLYVDVLKLRAWERIVWNKAAHVITVSIRDASTVASVVGEDKITVASNGVDIAAFPFAPKKEIDAHAPVFLFVGNFSWMQNRDAVLVLVGNIWNGIRAKYPDAILRIVGKNMPASLKKKVLQEGVVLLEDIEDIRLQYRKADVLVAPIRIGGGTKFKILEAMASGLPVVTTIKGIEGLRVENGKHVIVVDDPKDMVAAVDDALDKKIRESITKAARGKIEQEYSWKTITDKLLSAWQTAYERKR